MLALNLRVVLVHEVLDHGQATVLKLGVHVGQYLLDFVEDVGPNVLIPDVLEHLTRKFTALEALGVNKMAEVATGAPDWSMVVPAWYRPVVARFDQLVRVCLWLSRDRRLFKFVLLFELAYCFLSKLDQLVVRHTLVLTENCHDVLPLIYINKTWLETKFEMSAPAPSRLPSCLPHCFSILSLCFVAAFRSRVGVVAPSAKGGLT